MSKIIIFNMNKLRLYDAQKEKKYVIQEIECENKIKNRLKELGINEGKSVEILNFNFGKKSLMIKVMGIRLALDKKICEKIFVTHE